MEQQTTYVREVVADEDSSDRQQHMEYTVLAPLVAVAPIVPPSEEIPVLVQRENFSYHQPFMVEDQNQEVHHHNYCPSSRGGFSQDDEASLESDNSQRGKTSEDENGNQRRKDPFSPECKIPLPGPYGEFPYFDSSTFIRKRNERERARVRNVNDGFEVRFLLLFICTFNWYMCLLTYLKKSA